MTEPSVAVRLGEALVRLGSDLVFGVVGSGNFHLVNAMTSAGARFVAARHEGGAVTMADAYARTSGRLGVLSVHQGPGFTNAVTGIVEAAKSRTPLLVLAPEMGGHANFALDQEGLSRASGAEYMRVTAPERALPLLGEAVHTALDQRRTVVLGLPLHVLSAPCPPGGTGAHRPSEVLRPDARAVADLAGLLGRARRPVFLAGRGAREHREVLMELAERAGALLSTSAVAKGLFTGESWDLGVSGGFAHPLTAELIADADVIVGWGCSLNDWTLRHGRLVGPQTTLVQVEHDPERIGLHRPVGLGVAGDVGVTARAVLDALGTAPPAEVGYRDAATARRLADGASWHQAPHTDRGGGGYIDPRTLTLLLDRMLDEQRTVALDSGNFMGYPAMLRVPDADGFCFTQAFQSIGLGLATAIGAALARPDRLTVAALGDGGALMGAADLETAARLRLPMVIVVYDDEGYGAEVHHFGPEADLSAVTFPTTDVASVAAGYGCEAVTVRAPEDLKAVSDWLAGPRERPLLVDAKVARFPSWWLEDAFIGHGRRT
ncbi:thiamine pyrophosphate-binding protein [Nonomuraea longicatena]|uniref:thiamine pyrophosphate-binding protein n=1 Tax=Nonomuraea longicatena TaxID=83682 RepID=UPI0031E3138A